MLLLCKLNFFSSMFFLLINSTIYSSLILIGFILNSSLLSIIFSAVFLQGRIEPLINSSNLLIDRGISFFSCFDLDIVNDSLVSLILFWAWNDGINLSMYRLSIFWNSNSFCSFFFLGSINKLQLFSKTFSPFSFSSLGIFKITNFSPVTIILSSFFIFSINMLSVICFCNGSFSFDFIMKLISFSRINIILSFIL